MSSHWLSRQRDPAPQSSSRQHSRAALQRSSQGRWSPESPTQASVVGVSAPSGAASRIGAVAVASTASSVGVEASRSGSGTRVPVVVASTRPAASALASTIAAPSGAAEEGLLPASSEVEENRRSGFEQFATAKPRTRNMIRCTACDYHVCSLPATPLPHRVVVVWGECGVTARCETQRFRGAEKH